MTRIEGRLIRFGRTEEFNKQIQDNIDKEMFRCLTTNKRESYMVPVKYSTIVEAYKTGHYPLEDMHEQQHEAASSVRQQSQ
jgi:hypothetical protein